MAVAYLNLSGCAHWAERMQHSFLLLEGLLLHAPYLPALLAPGTGLATYTPFTWQPTFRETQNYFLWNQSFVVLLLKQLLRKTYYLGKPSEPFYNQPRQPPLTLLLWMLNHTHIHWWGQL